MDDRSGASPQGVISFRQSCLKALDDGRFDDLVLLLANHLRRRRETVSLHARASLPVDRSKASPIRGTKLTAEEVLSYDIRDKGWHLVALKDHEIVGAERFPVPSDHPQFVEHVQDYTNAVHGYYGEDAMVVAAFHSNGLLIEWTFLSDFTAEQRKY
ncbi:hypothetical protein [Litoreibacter roseus]|uniref:Uncharacterized protein n=1 Tax=Litoreibacter roseus TaxID=2601869 RepID=A0A6N6JNB2_9RHOB|nr:hypothetical protein [Litoreibacter roseus]GFE67029.1 hypothetical protein KIN_41030 [Litoreibacter roseus]